jgi:flagellar assembly protein FliH
MSSKIIRGNSKSVESLQWRSVDRAAGLFSIATQESLREEKEPTIDKTQILEMRLASMESEMIRRADAARAAGFREGEAAGSASANASLAPVFQQLTRTIQDLAGYRSRFRKEAEQDLVKLAISIARKILHRELSVDTTAILALVRVVLETIDAREVHRVRLHPVDAAVVEPMLAQIGAPQQMVISADGTLERGAAIFETTRGNIDASVQAQLSEIERGFADLSKGRQ